MTLAVVTIEEAVGADADSADLGSYLHLLGADQHSPQAPTGYTASVIDASSGEIGYTFERWIRARFEPPFGTVQSFRFWSPTLDLTLPGWTFLFGTTSHYTAPVGTASTIAVNPVPTNDPGRAAPNCGGTVSVSGDNGNVYSDWIVLQAIVDPNIAGAGPAYGYTTGDTPNLIEFDFRWTESET